MFIPLPGSFFSLMMVVAGPMYRTIENVFERHVVVESVHLYQAGVDRTWPIDMEGAETIEVS